LNPADNVAVARVEMGPGTPIDGMALRAAGRVGRGHKIAASAKVIKRLNVFRTTGQMPSLPYIGAGEPPAADPDNNI
jgi:hypothetical protein